jgi:hypothetical protein
VIFPKKPFIANPSVVRGIAFGAARRRGPQPYPDAIHITI